jgi:hypothetical protein
VLGRYFDFVKTRCFEVGFQISFRIRGKIIKKKSNNCCWFQLFWKTYQIFAWKNQQRTNGFLGSFEFSFPKNIENHLLHMYIYIYIYIYQELGVLNCWESQLIWTLRTSLIPDRGLVQLLIPAQHLLAFTIYHICQQHLFQWQDRAVQCTNSDLSFRVRQSALVYNSRVGCTQMVKH